MQAIVTTQLPLEVFLHTHGPIVLARSVIHPRPILATSQLRDMSEATIPRLFVRYRTD